MHLPTFRVQAINHMPDLSLNTNASSLEDAVRNLDGVPLPHPLRNVEVAAMSSYITGTRDGTRDRMAA